uniref:Sarcoglycan alpha/epsilon second domain-containing protein n=1 Tax=Strigamia maritima TaxID=126957 RepID=T1JJC7_STRMM
MLIVAINKASYNYTQQIVQLTVKEKKDKAKNEVEIWFSNLNVEDMFEPGRVENLTKIFRILWGRTNEEMYVTLIESAIKMGGRIPTNQSEKHGVVVRLGSKLNFSSTLLNLEQEVTPLRVYNPCPRVFKRTSAEMHFRSHDFIPDWCKFHLLYTASIIQEENGPVHSPIHLTSNDFHPPDYIKEPQDLIPEFILAVVAPIVTSILVLFIVAVFLCCYREGIEKRNKDLSSIQMVQYASIHRASNNLRSLATKREGSKGPGITPTSTIQRSYGSSPSSTLHKQTIIPKICESKLYENSNSPKIGSVLVENNRFG